jgi:hypothetical protein
LTDEVSGLLTHLPHLQHRQLCLANCLLNQRAAA